MQQRDSQAEGNRISGAKLNAELYSHEKLNVPLVLIRSQPEDFLRYDAFYYNSY